MNPKICALKLIRGVREMDKKKKTVRKTIKKK